MENVKKKIMLTDLLLLVAEKLAEHGNIEIVIYNAGGDIISRPLALDYTPECDSYSQFA